MNRMGQPKACVHQKAVGEACVAGGIQFKRVSVDKVPVHDNAHATIVSWRHNANQQNATFGSHAAGSVDNRVPLLKALRLAKNPGTQRRISPLALKAIRNNRPSNVSP